MSTQINNGGPAFPRDAYQDSAGRIVIQCGMSLRAWLAGQALVGLCGNADHMDALDDTDEGVGRMAKHATKLADAMIAELEVKPLSTFIFEPAPVQPPATMLLKQALTALDAPANVMQMLADDDLNNVSLWLFTEAKPKDIEIGRLQIERRELNSLLSQHQRQCIDRANSDRDNRIKMQALEMILQSFVAGADTEEIEALVKGAIASMHFEAENFTPGSDLISADCVAWEGFTKGIVAGISALAPDLHETLKGAVEEAISGIHHRYPEVPING